MTQRSTILEYDVTETQLNSLEEAFVNQFQTVLSDYDISVSKDEIKAVGIPILFDIIVDLGTSEAVEETVGEYVTVLLDEFGTKAGRNNIHFVSGRISTEKPDTDLADASRELYGAIKQREMDGR